MYVCMYCACHCPTTVEKILKRTDPQRQSSFAAQAQEEEELQQTTIEPNESVTADVIYLISHHSTAYVRTVKLT